MINRISLVVWFAITTLANAAHPVVPTFERFRQDGSQTTSLGHVMLGELHCTACHSASEKLSARLLPKQAPILTNVGSRLKPDYLRAYLTDPHQVKPGSTMPRLFDDASPDDIEALVHFLVWQGKGDIPQSYARIGSRLRGQQLYHQVGCTACHDSKLDGAEGLATSVPRGDVAAKYTIATLANFLFDPLQTRPSGRMPKLNLSRREATDIASYLLSEVPEKSGIAYSYYEGSWDRLPDFTTMKPTATGGADEINMKPAKRGDQFGLRFEGKLHIVRAGEYRFHLASDDGSRLWIDGRVVVDNDGVHGVERQRGTVRLAAGPHDVTVDFFERGGGEELYLEYEGPGVERTRVDQALMAAIADEPLEDLSFAVDARLAAEGKVLFASKGCASCHALDNGDGPIASSLSAPALTALNLQRGCLSNSEKKTPRFGLTPAQTAVIRYAIVKSADASDTTLADEARIKQTMLAYNCYACHARDGLGGVERARNAGFQTTQPEMGDEGRIPPQLDGVGAKLTSVWLNHILNAGAKDRPYMLTRMPAFGQQNVGQLAALLERTDHEEPLPPIQLDRQAAKKNGHFMVGAKGFSCIKCHTFGRFAATGVQSIDLTITTKRLRQDWFRRYLRNPQDYRRGTRMPSAWPLQGKSYLPEILDGESDKQIQAVWTYLSSGSRARPPTGLIVNTMELIPTDEAVIYRNFIEGAGTRAIGVGYPEGINLAFDANDLRLALIWKGSFIDAKRHWTGRGEGYQAPAGEEVRAMAAGVSIARLASLDDPWPPQSARAMENYRFGGYGLTADQRPTFIYSLNDARIEEFYEPLETDTSATLMRHVDVRLGESRDYYYRLAEDAQVTLDDDGWYSVGDRYRTKLDLPPGIEAIVRSDQGQKQLLVPITKKQLRIAQEFAW